MENPNVVQTYKRFKASKFKGGKGFTVYSVSLDKDKTAWMNAIRQDGLELARITSPTLSGGILTQRKTMA